MKFQLTMAKQIRGLGGGRGPTTAATPTNNIRGNNNNNFVLLPSGVLPNNTAAQDDLLLTPTTEDLLLLQPENLWLDLASDMSTFIELDSIPEVTETTAGGGSLLLPDLVKGLGLKEDEPEEMELMQAANMKILDEYHRCFMEGDDISFDDDGADDSMDSFAASDLDSNQSLIEEVETYLQGVSGGVATAILMPEEPTKAVVEEVETKAVIPAVVSRQETVIRKQQQQNKVTAEDNSRILKAMVEGKVLAPPADNSFDDSFTSGSSCDGSFELTEEDLVNAYTTTIKTENGQDVIIIIAQPGSPASSRYVPDIVAASPSLGSPTYSCSDDYEWSPSPQQQQKSGQRKKYQRKNRPTLLAEPYPRYVCFYYHCCGPLSGFM